MTPGSGGIKLALMPDANYRSTIQYPRHRFQRGIIRGLVHFLFFLLSDFRIEGKENLPKSGPLLLVGNHFSFIDPVSFIRVAPYPLEFIGGNQMPNAPSYLTWLTNTWDVIRVYRGNATLDGLRQAEEVLKQDGVLAIFPEAGNWADVLRPARPGAAFLAARTQAPLLPIGIDGLTDLFPSLRRGKRATIRLRIGKLFGPYTASGRGRKRRQQLEEIGHDIMRHIAPLIPPERRGLYSDNPALVEAARAVSDYPWDDKPDSVRA